MQGLVAVFLGVGNIVIEFVRDMLPGSMHNAEHYITIGYRINQNSHRAQVKQLVELQVLFLHLAPDTNNMFDPPFNIRLDILRQ
ncbi:hypothetical protein MnTg03_00905 [bacterium MnTg03]|nr:hypothetical protein MnTg03_00905 [bacterium MnTg03]